jgi:hypothetical protein
MCQIDGLHVASNWQGKNNGWLVWLVFIITATHWPRCRALAGGLRQRGAMLSRVDNR